MSSFEPPTIHMISHFLNPAGIARARMVAGEPPHVEAEGINFPGVWNHQVLKTWNTIPYSVTTQQRVQDTLSTGV